MAEMSKLYEEKGRELYLGKGDRERDQEPVPLTR